MFAAAGFISGFFYCKYASGENFSSEYSSSSAQDIIQTLSSPFIYSLKATGKVKSISNNVITLNYKDSVSSLKVAQNAIIVSFLNKNAAGVIKSEMVNLSDVKIGDNLQIDLEVLPEGSLVAGKIYIIGDPGIPAQK